MEGWHSGSPAPKNSECKNPLENFSTRFFRIKTASSSLITFQTVKLSTRSVTYICWCNWRHFKGKISREVHQGGLVLVLKCPQKKLAYLGFQCFDHPTYSPDLVPSDYHLFPGLKKKLKGRYFSSDTEVITAAETWLDGQGSEFFLRFLRKLEQRTKSILNFVGSILKKSRVWSL
jgi:hypothetical protein